MPYEANVLRIVIASPGDVAEERRIVTEEIFRWNDAHAEARRLMLQAVKWETHSTPRLGQAPQAELNEQIANDADILIGIFGTRIGTPTTHHVSGTVEEITNHVAAGKVAKVYFSDTPVQPSSIDPDQYKALQAFKEECKTSGLYATYVDLDSFRREFKQHLDIELNAPRFRWLTTAGRNRADQPRILSEDATVLLVKAARGRGTIVMTASIGDSSVSIDREQFTDGTRRSEARWRGAVEDLVSIGYVKQHKPGSSLFGVTHAGYQAADKSQMTVPLQVMAKTTGAPDQQGLAIRASHAITLKQIDYLHSTGACVASQAAEQTGQDLEVVLNPQHLLELNNSSRPDKNPMDHSGPAKLRLKLEVDGKRHQMELPVHLDHRQLNAKWYITLTGSAETDLM